MGRNNRERGQLDQFKALEFFHGTSERAALSILRNEDNEWFSAAVKSVVEDILTAFSQILGHTIDHKGPRFTVTAVEIAELCGKAGSRYAGSIFSALSNITTNNDTSNFSYSNLYVTDQFRKAADYAIRHEHGSEALNFILDAIETLEFFGNEEARSYISKHPKLTEIFESDHRPIVIAFSGLAPERLRTEGGREVDWRYMLEEISCWGEEAQLGAFRLLKPKASDVTQIYVLQGYNHFDRRPLPRKEEIVPLSPAGWRQLDTL